MEDEEIEEEDESDAVPHHVEEDTIALYPPSLPLQEKKDPIRGLNPSLHWPIPTLQR